MREGDLPADEAADLLALALTKVAGQGYDVVVAERVWKPLGAGEFSLEARGTDDPLGNVRAGCCMSARLGDWLRVGQLLVDRGVFEGNELAPPNYVKLMLSATHPQATGGYFTRVDGQFAARDLVWLEAEGKQRLWMIPSLDLAILRAGSEPPAAAGWDEALIPDSIVRGMRDWRPLPAGEEADLNRFAPH
jgi:CubicO group peptidase (beta-lactamase class C family)